MTLAELAERVARAMGPRGLVTDGEIAAAVLELFWLEAAGVCSTTDVAGVLLALSQERRVLRELLEPREGGSRG